STDGGRTWSAAALGDDLGRFAFRPFSATVTAPASGTLRVMARASNRIGQTQAAALIANPAGYHHNVIQTLSLVAAWGGRYAIDDSNDSACCLVHRLRRGCGRQRDAGASQGWCWRRQGRRQLRRLPQPRLHPDELAVPQRGRMGRGSDEDDQRLRRADQ